VIAAALIGRPMTWYPAPVNATEPRATVSDKSFCEESCPPGGNVAVSRATGAVPPSQFAGVLHSAPEPPCQVRGEKAA
jgi:hypothetical protein